MHVGIAGEVRCVVTKQDGKVKIDTGFQKNLILNQGLDFFGGGKGSNINAYCAIGSGNSTPSVTQTKLDAFIAMTAGTDVTSDYSYIDAGDGLYRVWEQKKYRFTGLDDANITELGLVSQGSTSENYYLTTRVLPKDSNGVPTSISLKTGETLDIYYKTHRVISTTDQSFVVDVLDSNGGSVPFNVVVRPVNVGQANKHTVSTPVAIDIGGSSSTSSRYLDISSVELSEFTTSHPRQSTIHLYWNQNAVTLGAYASNSYKRLLQYLIPLDLGNDTEIRSMWLSARETYQAHPFGFFPFQVRFGRVSDDAPLAKTANDTLTIPFEVSWGRFEGEL